MTCYYLNAFLHVCDVHDHSSQGMDLKTHMTLLALAVLPLCYIVVCKICCCPTHFSTNCHLHCGQEQKVGECANE